MNGIPTVLRLWLQGTLWGTACGIVSALVYLAGMYVVFGSDDGSVGDLLMGFGLVVYFAVFYGAAVGCVLGFATGLVAGLALAAMLRLAEPRAAVWSTVALVLLGQAVVAVAIFGVPDGPSALWMYAVVLIITVVPLTLATLGAVRDVSAPPNRHRDTLAA